jgi:4-amino-4-deoxy-L-arabinose transferase-like glycosyltransferase
MQTTTLPQTVRLSPHGAFGDTRTRTWLLLSGFLVLALVTKLMLCFLLPVTADESLHWMQGRFLDWGYADHPPGTALLSRIGTELLGNTQLGLRLGALLGTAVCSWIAWRMLRELGAERQRAFAGAVLVQLVPLVNYGVLMVPALPHAPLVFGAQWALLRALRHGRLSDHVAWGALLGLALQTYYLTGAAVIAAFVFLGLDDRGRRVLRTFGFWCGATVAVLVFLPNALWNLGESERSALEFQLMERNSIGFRPALAIGVLALAVVLAGPLLLLAVPRALRALRRPAVGADDWRRFFAAFVIVVLGLCATAALLTKAGAHWAIVGYLNVPLLLLAPHAEPIGPRWQKAVLWTSVVLAVFCMSVTAVGLDRAGELMPNNSRTGPHKRERFLHIADAARAAHEAARGLEGGGLAVAFATNRWSLAGLLSFHSPEETYFGVYPPATGHGRDYEEWNRDDLRPVELIYVTTTPHVEPEIRAASRSVERLASVGREAVFAWVHRCSGFVPPREWR